MGLLELRCMLVKRGLVVLLLAVLVMLPYGLPVAAENQVSAKIVTYDDGSGALVVNTTLPSGVNLSGYFYVIARSDAIIINFNMSGKMPEAFTLQLGQVMEFSLDAKGSKDKVEINYNLNIANNTDKFKLNAKETVEKHGDTTHIEATLSLEASGQYSDFIDYLYQTASSAQSGNNNITVNIKNYEKGKKLELEIKGDIKNQYSQILPSFIQVPLFNTTMSLEKLNLTLKSAQSSGRIDFGQGTFSYKGKITVTGDISALASKTPASQLLSEVIPLKDLSIDTTTSYGPLNYMSSISTAFNKLDNNLYLTLPAVTGFQAKNNQVTMVFPRVKAKSGSTEQALEQLAKDNFNVTNVEKTKASGNEPPVKLPDEVQKEYAGSSAKRDMLLLAGIAIVVIAVIAVLIIKVRK